MIIGLLQQDAGSGPLNTILGHRLQVPAAPATTDAWREELAGIKERLDGSPDLSFITVPFTTVCDYSTFRGSETEVLGQVF